MFPCSARELTSIQLEADLVVFSRLYSHTTTNPPNPPTTHPLGEFGVNIKPQSKIFLEPLTKEII